MCPYLAVSKAGIIVFILSSQGVHLKFRNFFSEEGEDEYWEITSSLLQFCCGAFILFIKKHSKRKT